VNISSQKWIHFPPASTEFFRLPGKALNFQFCALASTRLQRRGHFSHVNKEKQISDPRINERIRVPEVRLVGPNGEQLGIIRIEDALRMAQEADLDLVEVAPNSAPPVCKLMDFGKFKYEAAQKIREARKNQTNIGIKGVRFGLKIEEHDYGTKKAQIVKFLKAGDKVRVVVLFRGREQSRPEMGVKLLQRVADEVAEYGSVESTPAAEGRSLIMVIAPLKNKAEAKAEAKRNAEPKSTDSENE
jgi:translation initiation factor IF-3